MRLCQIMSVLLEAFSPLVRYASTDTKGSESASNGDGLIRDPRLEGNYYSSMPHLMPSLPLTGLSPHPIPSTAPSRFLAHHNSERFAVHNNSAGVENSPSNERSGAKEEPTKTATRDDDDTRRMEAMHIACKGLLILVKFLGGDHIKVSSVSDYYY
jgi:hypothetical protein